MFLSVMASPPGALSFPLLSLGLVCGRVRDDFCSAIEPAISVQIQISTTPVAARAKEQSVCRLRGWRKGKTGRAPGALTDAERTVSLEQIERPSDVWTGETAAALQGSEIVAHAPLYVFDRRAECGDIAFHQRGQSLHQDKAAEVPRVAVRERRKHVEALALVQPMHALAMGIQYQKNAPR